MLITCLYGMNVGGLGKINPLVFLILQRCPKLDFDFHVFTQPEYIAEVFQNAKIGCFVAVKAFFEFQ